MKLFRRGEPQPARRTGPDFTVVLRGYDRGQVDAHLAELSARLA